LAIAKDNPALAIQEFSKAVELEPDRLKSYKDLARLWGQAGKQKEAMQALR
jgi:Flp pilus assembly protein TadD